MKRLAFLFLLVLPLIACSNGPDANDAKPLLQKSFYDQQVSALKGITENFSKEVVEEYKRASNSPSKLADVEIMNLKLEDVVKQNNGDYILKATFNVKLTGQEGGRVSSRLTMTKVDGKWKLLNRERI